MRGVGIRLVICLTAVVAISPAVVAEPSGAVVAVVQQSQADGQTGKRVLQVEAPVFSGDKIITGSSGEAQIKFRDNTKLVVGPNSQMTIDAFVFDSNGAKKVALNTVQGAFRFISGNGPKSAYSINTPSATIGVRGTEFDFIVERLSGDTEVLTLGGTTITCPKLIDPTTGRKSPCIVSRDLCGLSIVSNDETRYLKPSEERDIRVNRFFRYALNQSRLHDEFRVDIKSCGNVLNVPTFENHSGGGGPPPPSTPLPTEGGGGVIIGQ